MADEHAAPYIFISYASADRDRAIEVANALERAGVAVWLDRRSIAGGTSWSAEIVAGIKGCAALVLLCSPAAMQSPNVGQEVQPRAQAWEVDFTKQLADDWVKMGGQVHMLPPEDLAKMKTLLDSVGDEVTKDQPAVHELLLKVREAAAKH